MKGQTSTHGTEDGNKGDAASTLSIASIKFQNAIRRPAVEPMPIIGRSYDSAQNTNHQYSRLQGMQSMPSIRLQDEEPVLRVPTPLDEEERSFQKQVEDLELSISILARRVLSQKHPNMDISQRALKEISNFVIGTVTWAVEESSLYTVEKDTDTISSTDIGQAFKPIYSAVPALKGHSHDVHLNLRKEQNNHGSASNISRYMTIAGFNSVDGQPQEIAGVTKYYRCIDAAVAGLLAEVNTDVGWIKTNLSKNGVNIWKKANTSWDIHFTKAVGEIAVPPKLLIGCIMEAQHQLQWDPLLKEVKILKRLDKNTELRYLNYQAKVCMLSRSRDFCAIAHYYGKSDGSFVIVTNSIEDEKCPPMNHRTRGEITATGYVIKPMQDGTSSEVTLVLHLDLKPELPEFITNLLMEPLANNIFCLRNYAVKRYGSSVQQPVT
eukprot:TRINITY_DN2607_c0_g1_i1.p1 TRINITY_DN2607_c0_g1~~TRINITY_DN2607_c0_g1_i1.p1  ORF type:complete len:484 (-),score=103.24 TRINITY_DN2607_c0_g1_i1:83-1390(-)